MPRRRLNRRPRIARLLAALLLLALGVSALAAPALAAPADNTERILRTEVDGAITTTMTAHMTAPGDARAPRLATAGGDEPAVVRAGRYAWAALGILGVLAVAGLLTARFALVRGERRHAALPGLDTWLEEVRAAPPLPADGPDSVTLIAQGRRDSDQE
jgi:hypothetical protein